MERRQRPRLASSFRAGTTTDTLGTSFALPADIVAAFAGAGACAVASAGESDRGVSFLIAGRLFLQYYRRVICRNRYILALALGFISLIGACRRGSQPARIGSSAPDFSIADSGRTVTLSQFRGKPVVLNFWATWCPPCVEEIPSLVALQKQLGDKVVILAVSTDVDEDAYRKFTRQRMQGLLTVRDPKHVSNTLYGTFAFPETYVIDRQGVIRRKFIGAQDWDSPEIRNYLKSL